MAADELTSEALLEQGIQRLRELLGDSWEVTARTQNAEAELTPRRGVDALLDVRSNDGAAPFLVDLRRNLSPRAIEEVLLPKLDLLRQVNSFTGLMVMAPWISSHNQQMLRRHNISYLDLTGNVSVRSSRPAVAIYTQGAHRQPRNTPAPAHQTTLAGPKAGRLVRLLADFAPPYRATSLAKYAELSLAYVSKLLDALDDQLIIRRDGRLIVEVDWQNLLRTRAEHLDLLRHNSYVGMLAPNGTDSTLDALRKFTRRNHHVPVAVTGPFAARAVSPIAAGGQLMFYVRAGLHTPDVLGTELGLLRVDEGADVLILRAYDDVVFARTRNVAGLPHIALSQLAIDCLSGTGRMPAEGEAVLTYMAENESKWRDIALPSI